jgi:NitT/TauT family transport system substrate-binding protein
MYTLHNSVTAVTSLRSDGAKNSRIFKSEERTPAPSCQINHSSDLIKGVFLMQASWWYRISFLLLLFAWVLSACGGSSAPATSGTPVTVRLGYFKGLHHAAAHVGLARKTYEQALSPNKLETTIFNVGTEAVNAMISKSIDISFIGSAPPLNGYVKSNGTLLRIISGAGSGGVLFVVHPDSNINGPNDLHGKKIADPGLGGTQDVSLRTYLKKYGLKAANQGGDVEIIPGENADAVNLFKKHQIDGAWLPEPFASRLVLEGNGKVLVDERTLWPDGKFVTTDVIVRTEFLKQHPDIVKTFLKAEVETVQYINANYEEAKKIDNDFLASLPGGKPLDQKVLDTAFSHLDVTYDPLAKTFFTAADDQYNLGYLGDKKPDLKGIYDLDLLNSVLKEKGLPTVTTS